MIDVELRDGAIWLNNLPVVVVDEDFIEYLREESYVEIKYSDFCLEYAAWEKENKVQ
jgi:hypothetical protein